MEKTVSSHPARPGTHWAVFLAPVAVTGIVIVGAVVAVLSSDPEPAERPKVRRANLVAGQSDGPRPEPAAGRGRMVRPAADAPAAPEASRHKTVEEPSLVRAVVPPSPSIEEPEWIEELDEDEDEFTYVEAREHTPEERAKAKKALGERMRRSPIFGPTFRRTEEKFAKEAEAESAGEQPTPEGIPPSQATDAPTERPHIGAGGVGPQ